MKQGLRKNWNLVSFFDFSSLLHKKNSQEHHLENKTSFSESDFLPAITHELKTPLNAIISLSEILQEKILNPKSLEESLEYIQDITKTAYEMKELVHDLLEVSGSINDFSIDLTKAISISDTIRRSIKLNHDYAMRRGILLKTEEAQELKPIKLDAKRMRQILTNLISNSVKYSSKGSEVKIITKENNDFLEIFVIDQGFGMSRTEIETAFEKYKTIPNQHSGIVDSFGLGLPIVKKLVEMQNGKIEVKSEVNKGTEVKLSFPYLM
jgi:two-component system, cell cycle sensor histidine kinase PleC